MSFLGLSNNKESKQVLRTGGVPEHNARGTSSWQRLALLRALLVLVHFVYLYGCVDKAQSIVT